MGKKGIAVLLVLLAVLSLVQPVWANTATSAGIMVNNQVVSTGPSAVYADGVLLMPAVELAAALGATFSYNHATLTGAVTLGENQLSFRLDNSLARHNGKQTSAPAPMRIIGGRFMLPVEFTAKMLGAESCFSASRNLLMLFQPVNGKLVYRVMSGDSLWILSRLFGVSMDTIRSLNALNSDMLLIDQTLIIKDFVPFVSVYAGQTTGSATLRSGAGFGFAPLAYLAAQTEISIVGKTGDWYKVLTPKGNGYMYHTVAAVRQDLTDTAADSGYFSGRIPVDTSKKYITYGAHTIQKGDTLWALAEKYGIPDYELAAANGLTYGSVLYLGQILKIPVHNIPVKEKLGTQYGELLDWFAEAQYVFPIGKAGKFIDVETGKSFMAKRTMGANHADTETLTAADTAVMKEIFGGSLNWNRRAFFLEVDGRRFAVSVSGMPHAGVDGVPYMQSVANRSDNWGYGPNYDRIAGNGMDGHFDVYFLNCLRHKDNLMDSAHQYKVMTAGGLR